MPHAHREAMKALHDLCKRHPRKTINGLFEELCDLSEMTFGKSVWDADDDELSTLIDRLQMKTMINCLSPGRHEPRQLLPPWSDDPEGN